MVYVSNNVHDAIVRNFWLKCTNVLKTAGIVKWMGRPRNEDEKLTLRNGTFLVILLGGDFLEKLRRRHGNKKNIMYKS